MLTVKNPKPKKPAAPAPQDRPESRERLLMTALRLFAEQGFSKTSIREIAQAAEVNVAAISYYFGDKAGLYRAVFREPQQGPGADITLCNQPGLSLRESLDCVLSCFFGMLKQEEMMQMCSRLHFRELIDPTGMRQEEIETGFKPAQAAIVALLMRHLGVTKADDDIHRLAFSIIGLGVQMFLSRDVVEAIRPKLLNTPAAIDLWCERMGDYAEAMVAVEAARLRARGRR